MKKILSPFSLKDNMLKSSVIVMFLKGIGILLGYLLTVIISKKYGPNGLGLYSIAYTTIIVFSYFSSFGLTSSILRFVGQFSKANQAYERKKLYTYSLKIIFLLSIIFSALTYLLSSFIATHIFKDPVFDKTIKAVAFIAPFFTLNLINVEFLRGLRKITASEIFRTVLIPLSCSSLILIYEKTARNIQWPVYALGVSVIAISICSLILIIFKLSKYKKKAHSELHLKTLLKTSAPMMIIGLSSFFIGNVSVYILQIFESKYQVGVFALSLKLSLFISFVLVGVNTVIAPKISELYWSERMNDLKKLIQVNTKFIFWLSFIIFLFIIIFSRTIINLINNEFIDGVPILIILAIGQLINATCGPVGLLLNMTGHESILMKATFGILILTTILNIFFVYQFGVLGAAIATAVSISLKNLILVLLAKKKLQINPLYIPFISKT